MSLTLSKTANSARTELELVAATRAGSDRAFEELYAAYRDRIVAFIVAKVHDHGRAEDIAQDVFMSALRRLRQTDQPIQFKPWIYEIAKNATIDEFRRGSRAREVPLESDGEFVSDRQPMLSVVPTPAAAIESKQRLDDLRGAFGGLSASHHRLLVMREFEGMSYDEIGDRLDMTRQMVESGLFRARRKLNEEYQELATGRRCEQVQSAIEAGQMRSGAALGIRERRRFSRHLAHCQPCRQHALASGVDHSLVAPRRIAAKIAALLPFPLPLWRWPWGRGARSLSKAGGVAEQAASTVPYGQAAAAVAILAIAGVGGGVAHGLGGAGPSHDPLTKAPIPRTAPAALPPGNSLAGTRDHGGVAAHAAWARASAAALHVGHGARRAAPGAPAVLGPPPPQPRALRPPRAPERPGPHPDRHRRFRMPPEPPAPGRRR